ncbi:MAG: VWA domain-containing protein [Hyphomicrobiaceae bacterium]|nr:VWA domain-containing protein [Hyphomicrobiaceae bacterium]
MPITLLQRISALAIVLTAVLIFDRAASPARAQNTGETPNVVMIMDASRSMWGQINKVNKIVSARNAVNAVAKRHEGKIDLGLVVYGHREATGCKDIQIVFSPERRKASTFSKKVNTIKPKGSTPIAASLIKAAEAAKYREKPANLVLIADGLDNCKADPCATASELKRQGKDLTIHTIAFDAKAKAKLGKLSCIAENGGGTFSLASNEAELKAGVKRAVEAAMAPKMPKIAAAPKPQLQARQNRQVQQPAPAPPPQQAMPKSDPLTTGTVGGTAARETASPPAPPAPEPVKQPKGALSQSRGSVPVTLAARTVEGGAIIKSGIVWWIYKNGKNKDGKYQLVESLRDPTPTAALPPGSYRVAATYGKVNLIKDINVQQGAAVRETFVLNAGGLRLGASTASGETIPPNSVRYDVFADETESDQHGNRKVIVRDAKPGVVLRLNAGAYHVVSTYGDANAIVRADVTVEPGRLTDAVVNHSAAKVTLKLVNQPGGEALANTQWNILTPGGDVVKESAGALPTHILAAGNYSVLAKHQGKNYTREFAIEPGEVKQIEVVIQ